MRIDEIVVIFSGILGIVFVYWFFLGKKGREVVVGKEIDIVVDGGYSPERIVVPVGETTRINFLRRDQSSCLEEVVLPDFRIKRHLPLNVKVSVEITPQKAGEYGYSCGMNMYHGKIIVS